MSSEQVVTPDQIQSRLTEIWDSLEGGNKMRACLFNLVIYAKQDKRAEYLYQVAQTVIGKFPSRVIFVTGEEDSKEPYLKTSVSVLSAQEGENEIVCDYINVAFGGSDSVRVPFVILPHILPDLPVYLLWGDDPQKDNSLLLAMQRYATRTIFDSECTENLPGFARALLEKEKGHEIADLNWARIEGWRKLLTSTFHSEDRLNDLKRASKVHIHYNAKESEFFCHTKIQAIYLGNWTASRLSWTFKKVDREDDSMTFIYDNAEGAEVTISIHPENVENLRPGRIVSVEIVTPEECTYSFKRNENHLNQIQTEYATPERCEMPSYTIIEKDESGQSLIREVCHKGVSKHYLNLIEILSTIQDEKLCH